MSVNLKKLESTNSNNQLAFAYLTCKRLYPNYVYFSKQFNFGDPGKLKDNIELIYKILLKASWLKSEIEDKIVSLDSLIPLPENFDTILASSAMDAGTGIEETSSFLLDNDFRRICDISTFATDTVYMFIEDRESENRKIKNIEDFIYNVPLMKDEIRLQNEIIDYLTAIADVRIVDIDALTGLQGTKSLPFIS